MKIDRRILLKRLLAVTAALALPQFLFAARPDKAFEATGPDQAIADLLGAQPADKSCSSAMLT